MAEGIRVSPEVVIPVAELEFRASRASGPGGQGVNTTDSRVELRFDVAGSHSLPASVKDRLLRRLGPRLVDGAISAIVAADPATYRAYLQTFASSTSCCRSVTRMKSQGCQFFEDGVRRPASRIRSRCSSGIGVSR